MYKLKKLNKLNKNKICFIILTCGLIFIFIILHRYKQRILEEEFKIHCIENLEEKNNDDKMQNISNQPDEQTEEKKVTYLTLTNNDTKSIENYVIKNITNAVKSIRPSAQGPPGQMGIDGPDGKPGGIFTNKGIIRSINKPNIFLDNGTKKIFLNNRTYKPEQTWIHLNDGKLENVSNTGNCLNATDKGGLEMSPCINSEKWKYIGETAQLQTMKPIGGKNKCLTIKETPEKGVDNKNSVYLDDCSVSGEQAWSFH